MKTLVILFTALLSISPAAWSDPVPPNNLMGEIPDAPQAVPILSVTEETNHNICSVVVTNAVQAKINKNAGLPLEESNAQLAAAIAGAIKEYGSDLDEPSTMANKLSYMMIKNIHRIEISATTERELVALGLTIYDNCFRDMMKYVSWEVEEE